MERGCNGICLVHAHMTVCLTYRKEPVCKAGLGIRSLVFRANHSFLWAKGRNSDSLFSKEQIAILLFFKEQRELFAHGHSFVKSDESSSLFNKEQQSKERRERFALGHQNGKKCQKHCEKYKFIRVNRSLFDSVSANHSYRSFLKSN